MIQSNPGFINSWRPLGGLDLTRQLSFLTNNYKYELGEDSENACILIPRYRAGGRVAPDGNRYPDKEMKANEEDLVPVRSIITKSKDFDIVTPDCLSLRYKDLSPGSGIGSSFGTSVTEAITQSALGLKHGGHERIIAEEGYLYAPKSCTVKEDGKYLVLECRGGSELRYPRPENLVLGLEESYKAGDIVGTAYNTSSPIIKLNSLIKLMKATGNRGKRYFEKDNVLVSECYAYEDGTIHYKVDKNGDIIVEINDKRYQYNPMCMYYFPEGAEVKKFDRICSGVANMPLVIKKLNNNIQDIYTIFRKQFYTLQDGGYLKEGLNPNSLQEELVEMLFISLINVQMDGKNIQNIEFLGTQSGIMNSNSFYTMMSFGYSSRVVQKALRGEADIKNDITTDIVLGLVLNNKLDEKK